MEEYIIVIKDKIIKLIINFVKIYKNKKEELLWEESKYRIKTVMLISK
jgi:hypothetical protein